MQRVLIIQTAFIGDVILMTPVVSELKRIFPDIEIDVLIKKGNENLLENNPKISTLYTFDKNSGKQKAILHLIRTFRKKRYDLIINLHRYTSSGLIAVFSGAKRVYGFRKNPLSLLYTKRFEHKIGDGTHEVTRNLSLISEFGADQLARPELFPSEAHYQKNSNLTETSFVCLAPASVWKTKALHMSKWIQLTERIEGHKIYLIGAPSDHGLCQQIADGSKNKNVVNLAGKHSLMETAALIDNAEKVYVNDSGPLHIASAMNTPTVAFFCSTIPEFGFGPLAEESRIEQVKGLDCRPCGIHGHRSCPKGHFKCGEDMAIIP